MISLPLSVISVCYDSEMTSSYTVVTVVDLMIMKHENMKHCTGLKHRSFHDLQISNILQRPAAMAMPVLY